jgi:hypothetical protein
MANTDTLDILVKMLRAELGISTNQSMGVNAVEPLQYLLRRVQRQLYDEHDWPQFIIDSDETILTGERYYTFNSDVNFDRIFGAWVNWSDDWYPLEYGITPEQYNCFDSDNDEGSDPVQRWRHYEGNQFEIWPIPTVDTTIRFQCIKVLSDLNAGTDTCDLDADLIVLFAAAEKAAQEGKKDAQFKLAAAQKRLQTLKGNNSKNRVIHLGLNGRNGDPSGGRINYFRREIGPRAR